ncbi:MAG: diacylglycerol/lipid kinase family protein [Gammaproteobacteria bacterium]
MGGRVSPASARIMAHDVAVGDPGWFIVVNPASGGGAARRRWPGLARALEQRSIGFRATLTLRPGHAVELVRDAIEAGARRVLAVGGDGTLHELVNGLVGQARVPTPEVLVACAPLGSGNDWARTFAMPRNPAALADAMARGRVRSADLGIATCIAAEGGERRVAFHNAAGAGLDAAVVRGTPARGPRTVAYLLALLRALARFRAPRFAIEADGQRREARCLTAIAAIGPDCGGGMRLAPGARVDDGAFELVTVAELGLLRALMLVPGLWNGRAAIDAAFTRTRCEAARIVAMPPADVEADGQLVGCTPLAVRVLPRALCALDCRESG